MSLWLTLAAIAFGAGIIKGFTGFGGSLVMAPLFALLLGAGPTLGTVVMINLATAWQLFLPSWRTMQRGVVLPMSLACIAATPFGMLVIGILDAAQGRRLIGIAVLLSGLALLAGLRRHGAARVAPTLAVGVCGGLLNGLAGMGGPPAALWLLAGDEGADRDRASLLIYVALTQAAAVLMATYSGALDRDAFIRALALAPLHWLGTTLGSRLFHTAPERIFKNAAIFVIIAVGLFATTR